MKLSWPKSLVKKWFNVKSKAKDFHANDVVHRERSRRRSSDHLRRSKIDLDGSQVTYAHNYRVFVATWNVVGKSPPSHLTLEDWLHTSPLADIYVLGFQEIVPLNTGNVLAFGHRRQWSSYKMASSYQKDSKQSSWYRFRVCDHLMFGHKPSYNDLNYRWGSSDDENESPVATHYSPVGYRGTFPVEDMDGQRGQSRYCLVANKQMVGIFLTIWVRSDLRDDVRNFKVSCVGRGLMGYLGNKVKSNALYGWFYLGGQKERNELRRNSDVMELLRKIRFPRVHGMGNKNSPQTILEHECDRILRYGRGLCQLSYVHGESRFSDHRLVYNIFLAEVKSINHSRIKKSMSSSSARIEVEELLP
ncbi:hypothetical protein Ancab_022334 [Ancistrocladus abbreviatus]